MQTKKSPISPFLPTPVLKGEGRFRRREHLKRRVEITRVFKKGRVVGCPGRKLFFWANGLPYNRIVITFARKYGNAVQRNRVRRLCREAYRLMKNGFKTGYDLVFLLYPQVKEGSEKDRGSKGPPGSKGSKRSLTESAVLIKTLFSKADLCRQGE